MGQTDTEGGTHWTERLTNEAAGFRVGLAHNNVSSVRVGYLPDTFQTHSRHVTHSRGLQDTLYNLPNTLQTPFRLLYSPLELSGVVGGWVGG